MFDILMFRLTSQSIQGEDYALIRKCRSGRVYPAFEGLELYELKGSRTVLREERAVRP